MVHRRLLKDEGEAPNRGDGDEDDVGVDAAHGSEALELRRGTGNG